MNSIFLSVSKKIFSFKNLKLILALFSNLFLFTLLELELNFIINIRNLLVAVKTAHLMKTLHTNCVLILRNKK